MFFDTHCHLNFKDYKDDSLTIVEKALSEGVFMLVVGSEYKSSQRAVALADKFPQGVYSAIGLHPIHTQDFLEKKIQAGELKETIYPAEDFAETKYQKLLDTSSKVVAIGEIGLDYHHLRAPDQETEKKLKNKQKKLFLQQLNFALKNKLPVIIHCREAHDDLYDLLLKFSQENKLPSNFAVIHCFSGDYEWAKKYFALGFKISFTGLITFNNSWDNVILQAPLENIMIETDAPYLAPLPYRGKRNNPLWVKEVAKKIAEIKDMKLEEVEAQLWKNSIDFFKINI